MPDLKRSLRKSKPTEKAALAAANKVRAKLKVAKRKSGSSSALSSTEKKSIPSRDDLNEDDAQDASTKEDSVTEEDMDQPPLRTKKDANSDVEEIDEEDQPDTDVMEDLDKYDSSFIDDEDMPDANDSTDDILPVIKSTSTDVVNIASTDEDEGDDDSEKIADPVRVKSKGKEPIRPTGPIRPKKFVASAKRTHDESDEEVPLASNTSLKKKRTKDRTVPHEKKAADELQLDDLLNALQKKAQQSSGSNDPRVQRILEAVAMPSPSPSRSNRKSASTQDAEIKKEPKSAPQTPTRTKKEKTISTTTPRTALANKLESMVMEGQITIEESLAPDENLPMDNLVPLPYLSHNIPKIAVLGWTPSVLDYYPDLEAAHRRKLTKLVTTPSFGPKGIIHNLAIEDPRKFCVVAEPGALTNSTAHVMKELLPDSTPDMLSWQDCAFVSFGQVTNSGICSPGKLGSSTLYNRSFYIAEVRGLWDRKYSAAYTLMAKYYEKDPQYKFPQLNDLSVRVYQRGAQFATAVEPSPAESEAGLPPGATVQGESSIYELRRRDNWFKEYLMNAIHKPFIPTHGHQVPVFDATHVFQGSDVAHSWDFTKMASIADIHKGELPNRALVAVLHSISRGYLKNMNTMALQFGVYVIIILCRADTDNEDRPWRG